MSAYCWMVPEYRILPNMIRVVLPVCPQDIGLMLCNLDWQEELGGGKGFDCLLSMDGGLEPSKMDELESAAWRAYSRVERFVYPKAPVEHWPEAPNWAFQHTARHMVSGSRPWFWMESDCVPLRPEWLYLLNQKYMICRKPIMGAIVKGMGHCNGTAVYPGNFASISRRAMECTHLAWDGEMAFDTIRLTCDASDIMCHVWGIKHGNAQSYGGDPAHFSTWRQVERWVNLRAAVFHRAKDTSLIERLREMRRSPVLP